MTSERSPPSSLSPRRARPSPPRHWHDVETGMAFRQVFCLRSLRAHVGVERVAGRPYRCPPGRPAQALPFSLLGPTGPGRARLPLPAPFPRFLTRRAEPSLALWPLGPLDPRRAAPRHAGAVLSPPSGAEKGAGGGAVVRGWPTFPYLFTTADFQGARADLKVCSVEHPPSGPCRRPASPRPRRAPAARLRGDAGTRGPGCLDSCLAASAKTPRQSQ